MKKALTASVAIRALFVSKINSRSGLLNVACLDVTADVDPVVSLLTDLPLALAIVSPSIVNQLAGSTVNVVNLDVLVGPDLVVVATADLDDPADPVNVSVRALVSTGSLTGGSVDVRLRHDFLLSLAYRCLTGRRLRWA